MENVLNTRQDWRSSEKLTPVKKTKTEVDSWKQISTPGEIENFNTRLDFIVVSAVRERKDENLFLTSCQQQQKQKQHELTINRPFTISEPMT